MSEPDHHRPEAAHDSKCPRCGVSALVAMAVTRLERRPWRLVWDCTFCGSRAVRQVETQFVGTLIEMFDVAGGSQLSLRELHDFRRLRQDADHFEALIREQILDEA